VASTSNVSLIAATLQLQLTQSLLNAIRTADLSSRVTGGPAAAVGDHYSPCRDINREPCYLPRRVIHPTPRYLPRPVIHPTPRYEAPECIKPCCQHGCKSPHITPGPPPPWDILPRQEPAPPADVIKIMVRHPDIVGKGNLIDLFI
jgi:hypothetical protein